MERSIEDVFEMTKVVVPPDCEVVIDKGVVVIRKKKIRKSKRNDS
jgi:hypothetical protein